MKFIHFIFFFFISALVHAQGYNALFINDSLRKGADVIKRNEEYILTIKSPSRYTLYEHHVYTILNPS